ncbi:MAG: hypothetical protein QOI74_3866 [Micromonosporaceae bacterium]|jgi:hypothetical protein|nr:hypothetical protein [Micromonosporaceae bacterium]MDT5037317.1 hypothetical protein [Micromonosporaceae bacterium]
MSEDFMNPRGPHSDYDAGSTAELAAIDAGTANGSAGYGSGDGATMFDRSPAGADIVAFTDDVDLAEDPFADDLSEQLAARAPRRYTTRTTVLLAGLVLLAGGFLAGAQVQKNFGTPASAATNGAATNPFAAGGFAGRGGGGGAGGAGATGTGGQTGQAGTAAGAGAAVTTGTVKLVDGATVYVQTADGNLVTVRTNATTAVRIAQNGALTDLVPGATVSVEGPADATGTVTATKVTKGN